MQALVGCELVLEIARPFARGDSGPDLRGWGVAHAERRRRDRLQGPRRVRSPGRIENGMVLHA